MKMTQNQIFNHIRDNIRSHAVEMDGNKIIGKRLIKSSSFESFRITFLKSGEMSIKTPRGRTMRYSDERDMFCLMGSFTQLGL